MKTLTPGYYDKTTGNYYFVSSGKGGKVFMTLFFHFSIMRNRHRMDIPDLPIRYTIEEACADLVQWAQSCGFKHVKDVYEDYKDGREVSA